MAKVELKYNPYLVETEIIFNGIKPRINSLVEKYQHESLQFWVRKVPYIFHDEMNGYDFDLEFSGTNTDFEEIKRSFTEHGVTEDEVNPVQKGTLKDRREKIKDLTAFLRWLNDNDIQCFDNNSFRKRNEELFDGAYSFIILNGRGMDCSYYKDTDVAIEYINKITELNNTDLTNTPILFHIDINSAENLPRIIKYILKRTDVVKDQLFFYIEPELSVSSIVRLIEDLGLEKPQLVLSSSDSKIIRYFELFPFTDYISNSIKGAVSAQIDAVNRISNITNSELHNRLQKYDEELNQLKKTLNTYADLKEPEMPADWIRLKEFLIKKISDWKKKKTKITSAEEAEKQAQIFTAYVKEQYYDFLGHLYITVQSIYSEKQNELFDYIKNCPTGSTVITHLEKEPDPISFDGNSLDIADHLMSLKKEEYVTVNNDFKMLLFMQAKPDKDEQILETSYYYQEWRDYACNIAGNLADASIQEYFRNYCAMNASCINTYKTILESLIAEKTEQLNTESAKLSDEERRIQKDNEWLNTFRVMLEDLKRG